MNCHLERSRDDRVVQDDKDVETFRLSIKFAQQTS